MEKEMKRLFFGLVWLLLTVALIFAQTKIVTVSGRVIEADSKEPVAQATVQLLSLPDSAHVAGITTSNKVGSLLPKQKPEQYLLKISFIGFIPSISPFSCRPNVPDKKVGTIELATDAVMLKEDSDG